MTTSKFVQIDPNVLIEYRYSRENLIQENFNIILNRRTSIYSYAAQNSTSALNRLDNQLVLLDPVMNRYGLVDSERYNFLQIKEYNQILPIARDVIRFYFPSNYTFGDRKGFFANVYGLNKTNQVKANLSNYFFDITDQQRFISEFDNLLEPLTFNGRLWGKFIEISIPSLNAVSKQLSSGIPTANSINSLLTNASGVSSTAPIFLDFSFIDSVNEIGGIKTFNLSNAISTSFPVVPDFENLAVKIESSADGDWFDIYGTYNANSGEFNQFIQTSISLGKRYVVEYIITLFEENLKGRTQRILITENFNQKVEFRPIIKYSTTTAIIDVEMRLIDRVSESTISRRTSFSLRSSMLSKYSKNRLSIQTQNIPSPIIYNTRNISQLPTGDRTITPGQTQQILRTDFPVMYERNRIVTKSDSAILDGNTYKGKGQLRIVLSPFDNFIKFTIAKNVEDKFSPFNLTNMGDLSLVFKNEKIKVENQIYLQSDENDLENGSVVFKIPESKIANIKKIADSNINTFYITSNTNNSTTVIYNGTFIFADDIEYLQDSDQEEFSTDATVEIRRGTDLRAVVSNGPSNTINLTQLQNAQVIDDIRATSNFASRVPSILAPSQIRLQ